MTVRLLALLTAAERLLTNKPGDEEPLPFHGRTSGAQALIKLAIREIPVEKSKTGKSRRLASRASRLEHRI